MPVVTVTSASLLTGNTSGLNIKGDYAPGWESANVILQDGAVFGGTVQPTTIDLGDSVRLQKAITPGDAGVYTLGNDYDDATINDIYSGAIYGFWSRSVFRDPTTVQPLMATLTDAYNSGLQINMNGENAPLTNQATLNSAAGATFFGAGRLTVRSAPAGTYPLLTRDGDPAALTSTVLQLQAGSIGHNKTVTVTNGFVYMDNTGSQAADATSTLNVNQGATLVLGNSWEGPINNWIEQSRQPTTGTIHIGSGGMLMARDSWDISQGATFTFDQGAIMVLRDNFNVDQDTLTQMPRGKGVVFIQDNQWTNSRQMPNFRMGANDWFISRTNDSSALDTTLLAYQGAAPGDTVGFAAAPGRSVNLSDVDLRVTSGGFALNMNVGNPSPMTTIVGDWNPTRVNTIMSGDTWFRGNLNAGAVNVQGGVMYTQMRGTSLHTTSVNVIGSSSVPYSVLYMERADDGTTQSYGHLEVGGPNSWMYLNDYTWDGWGHANYALGNALVAGTLADEVVVNDLGAFYFRLRADTPNNYTLNGVGTALKINEQIRFTGGHADDTLTFGGNWWDDNHRDLSMSILRYNDGNVRPDNQNNVYMPNIIIDQTGSAPVVVAIRPDQPNEGQHQTFLGLTFRSDGTTTNLTSGLSGNWDVVDAVSAGGRHTWNIGETGQDPMVHRMFGLLGGDMTANIANGSLTMMAGSSVGSGASFIVGPTSTLALNFAASTLHLTDFELMGGNLTQAYPHTFITDNAKFGGVQDLGNLDIQLTHGIVAAGGVVTSIKDTATSTWEVQKTGVVRGQLSLIGTEALKNVTAFTLSGGKLIVHENAAATGTTYVGAGTGASLAVSSDSLMEVDRETAVGGSNRWLTFGPMQMSGGTVTTTVGNNYGLAFAGATVTGTSAGFTTNGPLSIGAIGFNPDSSTQSLVLTASKASLGALSGASGKHITFTGGDLHLMPGTAWAADLRVTGTADRLLVDNDLGGYALAGGGTTISVLQGTTEILPGSAGTSLAGIRTAGLRFSDSAAGTTGPLGMGSSGAMTGNVILNTPIVNASFRQADGAGSARALRLGAATIRSEEAGNIFAAPLFLAGTTTLGYAAGGGQDFSLTGVIDGTTGGNFVKVGTETVTIGAPGVVNTYQGTTTINNGTIVMGSLQAFGAFNNTISVNGASSALSLGVAGANFGGGLTGYNLNLTGGAILDVAVAGVNLGSVNIGSNTLRLSNSMVGGTAPTAAVTGKTILNTPTLSSDYVLGLSGTIVANMDVAVGAAADKGNTIFQIASGKQITINSGVALTGNRTWDISSLVAGQAGILDVVGNVTGNVDLLKTGPGTLILGGAGNVIHKLTIGASPGGMVTIAAGAAAPGSVVINPGSIYNVDQINYGYTEVDVVNSGGIVGLSQNTNAAISFAGNTTSLTLGAVADSTFSGTLTAGDKYRFGGAPGTLTINNNSALAAGKDAQFGWATGSPNDVVPPVAMGKTIIASATNLSGAVDIYQHVQILNSGAFGTVAVNGVSVHDGGAIDFGNLLIPHGDNDALVGKFNMLSGGSVSNVGGLLFAREMTDLFGGTSSVPVATQYVVGSDFGGVGGVTVINGGLYNTGGLKKVGINEVDLPLSSTYSGATIVKAGTLLAPDSGSFGASNDITVYPGATLAVVDAEAGPLPAKVTLLGGGTFHAVHAQTLNPLSVGADALVISGTPTITADEGLTVGKITAAGPVTLTLNGAGAVDFTDVTNALTSTATLRIAAGRLAAHNNANGTQNSLGTSAITMAGGELYLNVIKNAQIAGLAASFFANQGNDAYQNVSGAYQVVSNNTFTGTGGLLAQTPTYRGATVNAQWNQPDLTPMFPGSGISADQNTAIRSNYMILWTGTFTAPTAGVYSFWGAADDSCSMWMDVNKDGTFTDGRTDAGGERIGNINWNIDGGSVTLAAGQSYNVAFTICEGGGGDWTYFWMQFPGAVGTVDIFQAGTG
jgi:autotransporter-associated beta strand protein